ncbi:MAG: family 10 glycosylhydrolase [Chitinophagaceae bacterium]|nr:family 10 glycosylhydrolase [Chitinophagaceae bacterium]
MKRIAGFIFLALVSFVASHAQSSSPNYEFRGVWVAAVDNIDWPSSKYLTVDQQKEEFIKLLDMHAANHMNAVIVQVRPAADAMYPSPLEPWSEFLTGRQGVPPSPLYDPLKFMITETHRRGMEFHAWLNPYRAVFSLQNSSIASNHVTRTHPDWFLVYGNKKEGYKKYFNPGLPEVMQFTAKVVKDIVTRYDIDAIHMDDYFYPYRISGVEFPDQRTYEKYGGKLSKDDWRRSNCDSIIKLLHDVIRSVKPKMKFGISPFGIWRNKSQDPMGSETRGGQTNYDDLYADILLWLQRGWIDYVVPQLYWERGHRLADYDVLLKWWNEHTYGRQMYIGHGIYRAGTNSAWRDKNELPAQIRELRQYPATQGSVYFSSKTFERNPNGWNDSLQRNYYRHPALIPPMSWLDNATPAQPLFEKQANGLVKLVYKGESRIKAFGVLVLPQGIEPKFINAQLVQLVPTEKTALIDPNLLPDAQGKRIFVVTVDMGNNVSPMTELK